MILPVDEVEVIGSSRDVINHVAGMSQSLPMSHESNQLKSPAHRRHRRDQHRSLRAHHLARKGQWGLRANPGPPKEPVRGVNLASKDIDRVDSSTDAELDAI